jgi:hypothetical protein
MGHGLEFFTLQMEKQAPGVDAALPQEFPEEPQGLSFPPSHHRRLHQSFEVLKPSAPPTVAARF